MSKNKNFCILVSIGIIFAVLGIIVMQLDMIEFRGYGNIIFTLGFNLAVGIVLMRYNKIIENNKESITGYAIALIIVVSIIWFIFGVFFESSKFDVLGMILISISVTLLCTSLFTDKLRDEIEL